MPIVEFADLPQRTSTIRQWHMIVWPKGPHRLSVGLVGDKVVKVYCHWDPIIKRPRPCPGVNECETCLKEGRRVYSYIAAVTMKDRDRVVCEISAACLMRMEADGFLKKPLRGYSLELFRKPSKEGQPIKPNDPVYYRAAPPQPGAKIPEKFSVMPSLLRLWGWTEENLQAIKDKIDAKKRAEPNCLADFLRQTGELE